MRFLLTGGTGILGTALRNDSMFGHCFWAPTRQEFDIVNTNVLDWYYDNSKEMFNINKIVHCAAYTDVPGAEEDRQAALDANVTGSQNVATLGDISGIPVVYISTDYVYPGETGNYKEMDKVDPINFYAQTKLDGERMMNMHKDLIIRTSFKPNVPWPHPNAFEDLYSSADYVDVIVEKLIFLITHYDEPGIVNVGTERKSIYELARKRNTKVNPMSINEIKNVKLPKDISMNLDKYNKLYKEIVGD